MFLPGFSYTPALKVLLDEIEGLRARFAGATEPEGALRAPEMAGRAAGACALDGIFVTADEAAAILGGAGEDDPAALAVRGYAFATERLAEMKGDGEKPLGVPALMALHFYLLYDAKSRKQVPGLRRERAGLVDVRDGTPLAFAPPPAELQAALNDLALWLHSSRNAVAPVLRAGIAHLRVAHLQPFGTANGRFACALANLLLLGGGFRLDTLPPVEIAHAALADHYYAAVQDASDTQNWTGDATGWLEYYCSAIAAELGALLPPADHSPGSTTQVV